MTLKSILKVIVKSDSSKLALAESVNVITGIINRDFLPIKIVKYTLEKYMSLWH